MLFAEPHRRQVIPHKIGELVHVETRFALKSRQLPHNIGDLRSVRTKTEPLRFVSQDNQFDGKLRITSIARLVER